MRLLRWLDRAALGAVLALPAFLMHGRAIAEGLVAVADFSFLARCAVLGEWAWLRVVWVRIAIAFWAWVVLCSLPGLGAGGVSAFAQALALARFLLLPAALEVAILRESAARRWLRRVLAAASLYIAAQTVLQLVTGHNLQGFRRNGDGELTGPFEHPRAAEPFSRLLFPVLLPLIAKPIGSGKLIASVAACGLTIAAVALMVLIGQRMPLLLTLFGLMVSGLMLRRLRAIAAAAIVAGAVLLAASALVSPPSFYRLVTKFSAQMAHFPDSDYGLIAGRAVVIALDHPVFGLGFDGFRDVCGDQKYFRPAPWPGQHFADGGGARGCNIHPHNHYLEAVTEAGLPGLALFCALVGAWWLSLLRGIGGEADPLRVGLFVSALIQEWPIASTGNFTSIELSGFFFVLLGLGLAEARAANPQPLRRPASSSTSAMSPAGSIPSP